MYPVILLLLCIGFIVVSTTRFSLHPFLALLFVAIAFGLASGMPLTGVVPAIQEGFGSTIGQVGIIIIAGTIIGVFLEKSGGAFALAERMLKAVGPKRVPLAMSIIGYITAIPVFADSGFVIFSALNRALTRRAGLSLATTAMALSLGLMVTHTLLPPTPGPIAAAGILNADLGLVIMVAFPISLVPLAFGWLWSIKVASRFPIDPEPNLTDGEIEERLQTAPSATRAFLPIVTPLVLIVLKSVADYPTHPFGDELFASFIRFVGSPMIALLIGVGLAFTLPRKFDQKMLSGSGWIGEALVSAAIIILITGAGGAFGKVLQHSGIAETLGQALSGARVGLGLPFIIAAAIRAAQGSATVAIITTASIILPMLESLGLDSELGRALTVVAVGAGSIFASHANDSFFWIVTQMSSMSVQTGYKLLTVGTLLMSLIAGAAVWVAGMILL